MADGIALEVDGASLVRARAGILQGQREATSYSVRHATKWLERELEAVTRNAVPGRLWRAWASKFYENDGTSPAGVVYPKGNDRTRGAIEFWSRPGRVRGGRGQWLAMPTDAVPWIRGKGAMTPADVEAKFGKKLVLLPPRRGERYPTLNLEGVTSGRDKRYRPLTSRRRATYRKKGWKSSLELIVMFRLIPEAAFGNTFAIEPVARRAEDVLADQYVARSRR